MTGQGSAPGPLPVLLRLATRADAAAVRAVYAPLVEQTPVTFELEVPAVAEMADRIDGRQPHHPFLVAVAGGAVAGYAYAGRYGARPAYGWTVETSVYVDAGQRGRGVGTALYRGLLELLAAQGYRRAVAVLTLPNAPSVALHEALGFRFAGSCPSAGWKFGAWHDIGWWQREVGDGSATAPPPPRSLDELDPERVAAALAGGPAS